MAMGSLSSCRYQDWRRDSDLPSACEPSPEVPTDRGRSRPSVPVDEIAHQYGYDPHVGLLRGWALALRTAASWWLTRPEPRRMRVQPAPARALPQTG